VGGGLDVGGRLGRYALEAPLGKGGMGEVYRALDSQLERRVALKILRQDRESSAEALARFIREAKLGARLSHGNAVQVFDAGVIDGTPFIAMEYLEGGSLSDRAREARTTTPQKIRWLADAARGLAAAHTLSILHRDVKPNNVLITHDGIAKVSDFGLGKRVETDEVMRATFRTQLGFVVGTPKFMAPEVLEGRVADARADQYSWALTAYVVLTGKHPRDFDGAPVKPPPRASTIVLEVPDRVGRAIERALSHDPSRRFSDMNELVDILASASVVVSPAPPRVVIHPPEPKKQEEQRSGVVAKESPHFHFQHRNASCPIAPLTAVAIATDGKSALGVSERGLARFEDGDWKVLAGLPPLDVARVTCIAAAPDGSYVFGGSRGTAFSLDADLRGKKWTIDLPNADRVTLVGAAARGAKSACFAGTLGGEGVLVDCGDSWAARVVRTKDPIAGVFARRDDVVFCGPQTAGRCDASGAVTFFERIPGNLGAIIATRPSSTAGGGGDVFACGSGGWVARYDASGKATIERMQTLSTLSYLALDGTTVWAATNNARFVRREGETWVRKSPDFVAQIRVLGFWVDATRLFAVCEDGSTLTATRVR
jgi:predicted Ser/Thr protein kinase